MSSTGLNSSSARDCLIVGGGVVGLSLAYELACHGQQVHVIDQGPIGREASWAGAGILPPAKLETSVDPLDRLRAMSHELHSEWAKRLLEETGIDTGYRECGGIYLARSVGEAASLHAFAAMLEELDIAITRLSPNEVAKREPALGEVANGKLKAAYSLPGEAQLRNPDHLRALAVACEQRGVQITSNCTAVGFEETNGSITAVLTESGSLTASQYCITSGAWSVQLLGELQITTGIMPIRGQMALFKCENRPFSHVINEGPRYLVPRDDGYVLVGSTEEEVGFDKSTTDEGIGELISLAKELIPALRHATIENTWGGLRPGSFDGFPYIGRLPGLDNAFAAAGHYRSGLHMSPGTAVVLRQLMLGDPTDVDLAPFRVGRG